MHPFHQAGAWLVKNLMPLCSMSPMSSNGPPSFDVPGKAMTLLDISVGDKEACWYRASIHPGPNGIANTHEVLIPMQRAPAPATLIDVGSSS